MRNIDEHTITEAVLQSLAATPDPRLKQILNETVAKMRSDGSLNKISVKWLNKPLDPKDL